MKNPFQYGGVVEGAAFCNRKKELADLTAAVERSEKLFLYSDRRLGKTSLVQTVLRQLPKGGYASAYADLWPTDGELSFVAATARAITESMGSTDGQLLEFAKQLFSRLTPSVTADAEDKPKVTFGFNMAAQPGPKIEEVLAAPAKIAERGKRRVVIVFDEVLQILEYESDLAPTERCSKTSKCVLPLSRQQKPSHSEDVPGPLTATLSGGRALPTECHRG